MRALVLPMRYANGRTRRDETLTSFLARISGQKNAISNGCKAGPGSHELDKVRLHKILVSYITLGAACL